MQTLTIEVLTPGFPIVDGERITRQGSRIRVRGLLDDESGDTEIVLSPDVSPEAYGQMASAILSRTRHAEVGFEIIYPKGEQLANGIRREQPQDTTLGIIQTRRFPWKRTLLFWKK